jgi:hypothetical protein
MSGETNENENEDLKAFEAALGALRPRTDRLDRRWRWLLAKEASLSAAIASDAVRERPSNDPLSLWERVRVRAFGAGKLQSCASPLGHQFVCIHCGSVAPISRIVRRWAWPAALSTMTAIAAILLVMLVTRSEPQIAVQEDKQGTAIPASSVVQRQANPASLENGLASGYWLAMGDAPRPPRSSGTDEMCYLTLRDQVLRDGVESWKSPVSPAVRSAMTTESPLNYRELLDRLLEQQGLRGS